VLRFVASYGECVCNPMVSMWHPLRVCRPNRGPDPCRCRRDDSHAVGKARACRNVGRVCPTRHALPPVPANRGCAAPSPSSRVPLAAFCRTRTFRRPAGPRGRERRCPRDSWCSRDRGGRDPRAQGDTGAVGGPLSDPPFTARGGGAAGSDARRVRDRKRGGGVETGLQQVELPRWRGPRRRDTIAEPLVHANGE